MNRLLGTSVLWLAVALAVSSASADDAVFRTQLKVPIFFAIENSDEGAPNVGGNSDIEIVLPSQTSGRIYGALSIPVTVAGIDAGYAVSVAGLPSEATWVPGGDYGVGRIVWTPASTGIWTPVVEVRSASGDLVASAELELEILGELTAAVPQSSYDAEIGDELSIEPSIVNSIGATLWGSTPSPLPDWLSLDAATGAINVDTSAENALSNIVLTAVDQADHASASTVPFSVAVKDACDVWTAQAAAEQNTWYSVTYGNGLFVAVASSGTRQAMTSPDGINWTARTTPAGTWVSVTYGKGKFVAVASTGTNRVMTSPDGTTWTVRTAVANSWNSVAYGDGMFVAVASGNVMTSPDGITWTSRTAAGNWVATTYGKGMFVAVADGGTNRVMTSSDKGATWTSRTVAGATGWRSVTFGNDLFVAVVKNGTNRVMVSGNGATWSTRTAAEANDWSSIAYGNGMFVAVSFSGTNKVMTSPDTTTWTARSTSEANGWNAVAYGDGRFVAVTYSGGANRVMTSNCH